MFLDDGIAECISMHSAMPYPDLIERQLAHGQEGPHGSHIRTVQLKERGISCESRGITWINSAEGRGGTLMTIAFPSVFWGRMGYLPRS
jgi:hypothetical protein